METETAPDDRALRTARRDRALAQMRANGLDLLVLGRQANVRYVTGVPQLWVAGTRPFAPVCVLDGATGEIHLNSTSDEGMPEEIDHDHLYGLTWSPMTLIDVLKGLPRARQARRVGSDAMTPTFAELLPIAFPNAELVNAEPAMRAARRVKTPEELAALTAAVGVAEAGIGAGVATVAAGVSEKTVAGAVLEAMAAGGVTTPASQDAAWITSRERPWQRADGSGHVQPGDLVALSAGALAGGYVGEVGRTVVAGADEDAAVLALRRRADALAERLIDACRDGAAATDLFAAYEAAGEPLPVTPIAYGLGLGFDPPVLSTELPRTAASERLETGMVLAVTTYVWQQGIGALFQRDAVLVDDRGGRLLDTAVTAETHV
ncbi:peptidase M24 [Mycolicibacterium madagascariense]|uniref:Peptidase M24 n=1 Tax=Mycolicibacterium madagascariense TaxID=212765 RepID=A0A7I7XBI0_9MYCO|nr:M24 family metallopeptidase [Mycolicibacterium madagascariense]MCV7011854.1 aminopeptidase P family protein [Mycolicibacterium madagascariense]BBZ26293.1 peptidase M24 [Mycolicibacterium madagascariense]